MIEKNSQSYVVRGIGLLTKPEDIGNIIVKDINNVPVLVRNVAQVKESNAPRVGQAGLDDQSDVVEGIVVMRKGETPAEVLSSTKRCYPITCISKCYTT